MIEGLIIGIISNICSVKTKKGIYKCTTRGKMKKEGISPVVGDNVIIEKLEEENKKGVIIEILQRRNYIKRPKIANLTQLIFVVSIELPKPDLLLLDKQLIFAEYNGIEPVICLNKIDLDTEEICKNIKQQYSTIGYKVIETSAKNNQGVEQIKKILENNITAFSGNSGVGKSTLINALFNKEVTLEGKVSDKNKRGKNTTTSISLYEIDENSYIADTPGFSTFEIDEIESKELGRYFVEFDNYIDKCEYAGCSHILEQNCGIKDAIQEGKISVDRYNRYKKIYEVLKDKEEHKW